MRTVRDGGGELTRDDLAAYRVSGGGPFVSSYRGHEVLSNPPPSSGGILIAYGLRCSSGSGARRPERRGVAALAEVMREQTRARAGGFVAGLHRGGLQGASRRRRARGRCRADRPRGSGLRRSRAAADDAHLGRRRRRERRLADLPRPAPAPASSSPGPGST